MKIWLDDLRPAPNGYTWVKDFESFVALIDNGCPISHISFDHDLGAEKSGYDCAKVIEELAYLGKIPRLTWNIHTANPSGEVNLLLALNQADKYWENNS